MRLTPARLAGLATIAAVLLVALLPMSYTSQAGCSPRTTPTCYDAVRVNCGIGFNPKNPPPPPGVDDQCDAAHWHRATIGVEVFAVGAIVTSVLYLVARRRVRAAATAAR